MQPSTTKLSPLKLSEIARKVVVPAGVVTTGWPAVQGKCAELGISFRPWQPDVGRLILAKRADGKYASTIGGTGLSIPRQVGKTFLVGAIVFALCLLLPNLTVIWTAHRLRTAEETFGKMQAFAKRKRVAPHIAKVVLGSGDEAIIFRNGSRILFGARERGFGRGFDRVDVLIFDEAQILSENALDDMIPATNQSLQPTSALLLFMGTPPKPTDPGEVFTRMRSEALTGEDPDTAWVEFGADPDFIPTPLPLPFTERDWRQITKANPSYPQDTPREAILRMRKKLGADSLLREGFGIWDTVNTGGDALSVSRWSTLADPAAELGASLVLGVDVDESRLAHIGLAWQRPDEGTQVMLTQGADLEPDTDLSVPAAMARLVDLATRYGALVVVGGASSDLTADLEAAGVSVVTCSSPQFAAACGRVDDGVKDGSLHHGNQPVLNESVRSAKWRSVGTSGERAWQLKNSAGIGPLAAVTRAIHGLNTATDTGWVVGLT